MENTQEVEKKDDIDEEALKVPYVFSKTLTVLNFGHYDGTFPVDINNNIYLPGYKVRRSYFSYKDGETKEDYICEIKGRDEPEPFRVYLADNPDEEFKGTTCGRPWSQILKLRKRFMSDDTRTNISGPVFFGVTQTRIRARLAHLVTKQPVNDLELYFGGKESQVHSVTAIPAMETEEKRKEREEKEKLKLVERVHWEDKRDKVIKFNERVDSIKHILEKEELGKENIMEKEKEEENHPQKKRLKVKQKPPTLKHKKPTYPFKYVKNNCSSCLLPITSDSIACQYVECPHQFHKDCCSEDMVYCPLHFCSHCETMNVTRDKRRQFTTKTHIQCYTCIIGYCDTCIPASMLQSQLYYGHHICPECSTILN
mmetsp:Transcript_9519/g.14070  ORF Transcript_9519/g.14070 Transcript_9519/m.14070 type:complete len:369 (-) Transcript_9519:13-1119(-)